MPLELPQIVSLTQLEALELKPPAPLISTFLECGSKFMLVSNAKGHKTWMLLDLAFCLTQPISLWLGMKTHQCKVLYINFELHPWFFRERVREISKAYGITPVQNSHLDVWNLRGCSQDARELTAKIRERLQGKQPYLLTLVDPFYKFSGSNKVENAAEDMSAVMRSLDEVTVSLNVAVGFAHHSPKGDVSDRAVVDRGSGSGVFGRDPDAIVAVSGIKGQENEFQAEFAMRYHPPKQPFGLRWEFPLMKMDESVEPRAKGRPKKHNGAAMLALLNGEIVEDSDWREASLKELEIPRSSYQRLRDKLEKDGFVERQNTAYRKVVKTDHKAAS